MNLYHVTKFSPYSSFTVYCFYTKISSFMPVLSIRIVLDCFYLLIFYSEKFSTHICRLPYATNVNLNLSSNLPVSRVPLRQLFVLLPLHYTHHICPIEITCYENNTTAVRQILSKHITQFPAKTLQQQREDADIKCDNFCLTLKDPMIFSKSDPGHGSLVTIT